MYRIANQQVLLVKLAGLYRTSPEDLQNLLRLQEVLETQLHQELENSTNESLQSKNDAIRAARPLLDKTIACKVYGIETKRFLHNSLSDVKRKGDRFEKNYPHVAPHRDAESRGDYPDWLVALEVLCVLSCRIWLLRELFVARNPRRSLGMFSEIYLGDKGRQNNLARWNKKKNRIVLHEQLQDAWNLSGSDPIEQLLSTIQNDSTFAVIDAGRPETWGELVDLIAKYHLQPGKPSRHRVVELALQWLQSALRKGSANADTLKKAAVEFHRFGYQEFDGRATSLKLSDWLSILEPSLKVERQPIQIALQEILRQPVKKLGSDDLKPDQLPISDRRQLVNFMHRTLRIRLSTRETQNSLYIRTLIVIMNSTSREEIDWNLKEWFPPPVNFAAELLSATHTRLDEWHGHVLFRHTGDSTFRRRAYMDDMVYWEIPKDFHHRPERIETAKLLMKDWCEVADSRPQTEWNSSFDDEDLERLSRAAITSVLLDNLWQIMKEYYKSPSASEDKL